jgi:hypothetical protein
MFSSEDTNYDNVTRDVLLTHVVAPGLFNEILCTPSFTRLHAVHRLGSLANLSPELAAVSAFTSSLRMVVLTSRWVAALQYPPPDTHGYTMKDRLCVELAALIYNLGRRSWVHSNWVRLSPRPPRGTAHRAAGQEEHEARSIREFQRLLVHNQRVRVSLHANGIGPAELQLTYAFVMGEHVDHPFSCLVNNTLTQVDVKNMDLFLCCTPFWRGDFPFLAWTTHEITTLLSNCVIRRDPQVVPPQMMTFHTGVSALINKFFMSYAMFQNGMTTHALVHGIHLLKFYTTHKTTYDKHCAARDEGYSTPRLGEDEVDTELLAPGLFEFNRRLECGELFTLLSEEKLQSGSDDEISSISFDFILKAQFEHGLTADEFVISPVVFNASIYDVFAPRVISFAFNTATLDGSISLGTFAVPVPYFLDVPHGVLRLFATRPCAVRA